MSDHSSSTVGLDEKELVKLLEAAAADGLRSAALMTLLALNALRVGEALSRDIDDLTYDFGHLVLRARLQGRQALDRGSSAGHGPSAGGLHRQAHERVDLPRPQGRPHDRADAWRLVRRLARRAGLPAANRLSPHSLRHSAITAAL